MNIKVLTFASDTNNPNLKLLEQSLHGWGWNYKVLVGKWEGFHTKMQAVVSELPQLESKGYTHAVFVDGYDTICMGPSDELVKYLTEEETKQSEKGVFICSAEIACWPDESLAAKYGYTDEFKSRFRYLNSGGYVGSLLSLQELLSEAEGYDQLYLTHKFLLERNKSVNFSLDTNCRVFQTIGHVITPWASWDKTFDLVGGGRIYNKETGTYPVFIHANGGGPHMYEFALTHTMKV